VDEQERSAYLDSFTLLEARNLQDFKKFNELLGLLDLIDRASVINAMADILTTELAIIHGHDDVLQRISILRAKLLRDESE
jgi:hypothetical protein